MRKKQVGLQLYSVREDCERDFSGTLEAVAEMGYEGVEFLDLYGRSAEELRAMLDKLGLKPTGIMYFDLAPFLGDALEPTVEFNKTLGSQFLIVGGLAEERTGSKAGWLEAATLMNEIAQKVKPEGLRLTYHNHTPEFMPIDGEMPWDILAAATSADVVMELDTGNALHGEIEPDDVLETLKRYPGRAATVHLKEYSSTDDKALLGEGDINWREFLKLCETVGGTEWYIVEQESYAYPPLECVRRCLENLRPML